MPRPKTVENEPVAVAPEPTVATAEVAKSNGTATKRSRREGTGLVAMTKATPPVVTHSGPGRVPSAATMEVINNLKADSGEWYLIGRFGSPSVATGVWERNDIVFTHSKGDDGLFDRYAKHDPQGAAERREASKARKARKNAVTPSADTSADEDTEA